MMDEVKTILMRQIEILRQKNESRRPLGSASGMEPDIRENALIIDRIANTLLAITREKKI